MATATPPVYEELLDLLADERIAKRILKFHPSSAAQATIEDLLERNREGRLSAAQAAELDEYERLEHLVRLLKARVRQKRRG